MPQTFSNRKSAGQALAEEVAPHVDPDALVLALPRGGVPVAHEIAAAHDLALDLLLVRKLGVPGHEERAFGAIASGGARHVDESLCRQLGIDDQTIEAVTQREQAELNRRAEAYRGDRPQPDLSARSVFLVDDGVATGATMQAGIEAVASQGPPQVNVALPVAPPDTVAVLDAAADEVICLQTPARFAAIGQWYDDFEQVTDEQVRALLEANWLRVAPER
jgi:predicted phosphoribosyltransferase